MFNERQLRIISLLQSQEKVSVSELTAEFGVSLVTVRQDLKKLEDQGVLKRTHGGAVAVDNGYDTSTRMWNNYEKKQRIVQRAAGLVSDGETIIIETGSTCSLLARELATKRGITITPECTTEDIERRARACYGAPLLEQLRRNYLQARYSPDPIPRSLAKETKQLYNEIIHSVQKQEEDNK